jgi:hypothetical protein
MMPENSLHKHNELTESSVSAFVYKYIMYEEKNPPHPSQPKLRQRQSRFLIFSFHLQVLNKITKPKAKISTTLQIH